MNDYEFISTVRTEHTGGNIYNDVVQLKDGTVIRISEGAVVVFKDALADEDRDEIGHVYY